MGRKRYLIKFDNPYQIPIWAIFLVISLLSTVLVAVDTSRPDDYGILFLLPLTFTVLSIAFSKVYSYIFSNIGVTLLLVLMFIRCVFLPLLMSNYGYETQIVRSGTGNIPNAVILMCYEMLCLFVTISLTMAKYSTKSEYSDGNTSYTKRKYTDRAYIGLLIVAVLILVACIRVAPVLMTGYRSILRIGEADFATYEDTSLISKYGTTTTIRFALVTGNYLMRALLAIVPGVLIIKLAEKRTFLRRLLSLLCCFIPTFFIGGVIARTLVYIVVLLLLYFYLYTPDLIPRKTALIIVCAGIATLSWWAFKANDSYGLQNLTNSLNAYFSGVNNTAATYNLKGDIGVRASYFLYDYIDAIPYSGTIFHSSHELISTFFNNSNGIRGQIPTTIGIGRFYFGPIFAPIYSIIFAYVSVKAGEAVKISLSTNPLRLIRLLLTAMYFAMGVIMYNISITMTNFFTILFPMYLMELIAYKRNDNR